MGTRIFMSQVLKEGGDTCGAYLYMDAPSARATLSVKSSVNSCRELPIVKEKAMDQ
jgi:hypothetical protein